MYAERALFVVEGAGVGKVLAVVDVANEVSVVGVVTGALVVVVGARIRNSCIKQLVHHQIQICQCFQLD